MNFESEDQNIKDSIDTAYILERSKSIDRDVQRSFIERKWVWVPHHSMSYVSGYVVKESKDHVEVNCDGQITRFKSSEIMKMNPPKFDMVEDLAALSHLNEPSVLYNLKKRYEKGLIYTYSGLFLLAVNPYRNLKIYSEKYLKKYTMNKKYDLEPHIYAVANEAYNLMLSNRENQSILITGESGAGKTENTKKVIEFLASVAGYRSLEFSIDKKIIDSNPILESFGNAKTVKNDNSSRFGKFIQIKFNGGNICGANIEKYLLEKSRITSQNSGERNYHIFYQLLRGADQNLKKKLLLDGEIDDYRFLRNGCRNIDGVDDAENFRELRKSMKVLNIGEEQEIFFYKIVSAVLHLGNLEFVSNKGRAEIKEHGVVDKICLLLKISAADFIKCLLHPVIKAGNEVVTQHRTVDQAYRIVEALAKLLYDKMFDEIINRLNKCLGTTNNTNFIGVLDIAGFEIFTNNSFEQLCINFTNEKLQQFFNHHMFILEQEIYKKENIDWNFIDFGLDLQPTIDLIEKSNPIGILSYLDEECVMPCASDKTFLEKLLFNIKSSKFKKVNFKNGFVLEHYAGEVEYNVDDWLVKNKDPNFENLTLLINKSDDQHIASLSFEEGVNLKKGFFRTVSQRHREQLSALMKTLFGTNPHFVRCIIPNFKKTGEYLDNKIILEQLKCNGVLEGIRISRQGFPSRLKYSEFVGRYKILLENIESSSKHFKFTRSFFHAREDEHLDNKEISGRILEQIKINSSQFRLGKTKIFFRQGVLADIEDLRDLKITFIMKEVQALARRKLLVRNFNLEEKRKESIRLIQKNARLSVDLQKWNWWKLYLKIKPLLDVKKQDNELKEKEIAIQKYMNMIEEEKDKIKNLETKLNDLSQLKDTLMRELESEKQFTNEKNELMEALRGKNEELCEKLKKLEADNSNVQEFLEQTFGKLKEENIKFKNKIEMLENERNKYVDMSDKLEEEIKKKEEVIRESNLRLLNTETENKSQFESFLESKDAEINSLKEDIKNNKIITKNIENELNISLEQQAKNVDLLNEMKKKNDELQGKNEDLLKEVQKWRKSCEELEIHYGSMIKKLKEENSDLQIENERLEREKMNYMNLCEERDETIKKVSGENEFIVVNNENLKKTNKALRLQIEEFEEKEKQEREKKLTMDSTREGFHERIKVYEKKVKSLGEKCKHLEILNNQLSQEKEELHKENLDLLQSKLDDIFEREAAFNTTKKNLKLDLQKLEAENQRLTRELYEQKIQSESSDDSLSASEKLYGLLEHEKKIRREAEQLIIESENRNLILKNELEELKYKCEELKKEKDYINEKLLNERSKDEDYALLQKEVDGILENVNAIIDGFRKTFFRILEDNKKRILDLICEIEKKEAMITELSYQLYNKEENIRVLEKKNQDLNSLNNINNKKISNICNEFDSTKVRCVSLECSLKEKENEIEKYKEDIKKTYLLLENVEEKYKKELESIGNLNMEREALLNVFKQDHIASINNIKNMENRSREVYEERINTILEMEKNKRGVLERENKNLIAENKTLETNLLQLQSTNVDLNLKIENLDLELNELRENERYKNLELEDLKIQLKSLKNASSSDKEVKSQNENNIVYVLDKQKLQDIERKRLILENECNKNKKIIKRYEDSQLIFTKERDEFKKEISELKKEMFELRKINSTQNVMLSQIQRELNDERDLVEFLKSFGLSKKSKK